MPNFKVHIITAIYTYPLYLLIFYLITTLWNLCGVVDPVVTAFGFFVYVLGSDLPDIDAAESLARRIAEVLIVVIVASGFFSGILWKYASDPLIKVVHFQFIVIPVLFFIAILAGVFVSKTLKLFKHRGFLHSLWAALIYSGIIFSTAFSTGSLKDSVFLSLAAFLGYNLHRLLDSVSKGG